MKQPLSFRAAQPADLPHIAQIDRCVGQLSHPRRFRVEQALLELRCWLATAAEVPVAYGLLQHDWFGHPFIELLVVHPGHRRRGIGRAMLCHLLATAGPGKVFASTNESNEPMRRLLESEGFTASGVIHNLDEGDPERVFVKSPVM